MYYKTQKDVSVISCSTGSAIARNIDEIGFQLRSAGSNQINFVRNTAL
jgi:hypothetical protein